MVPLFAVLVSGCGTGGADDGRPRLRSVPAAAVATVAGHEISRERFDRTVAAMRTGASPLLGGAVAPDRTGREVEQAALSTMIQRAWTRLEADRVDVAPDGAALERARATLIRSGGGMARFAARLKRSGLTAADVDDVLRAQLSHTALLARARARLEPVTRAEARRLYDRRPGRFQTPATRTVEVAAFDRRAAAERARRELAGGAAIITVSRSSDAAALKVRNGQVTVTAGSRTLPSAVLTAVFAAKRSVVGGVIAAAGRFYVFRVIGILPARTPPFSEVERLAQASVSSGRTQRVQSDLQDALRRRWRPVTGCAPALRVPKCAPPAP